MKQEQNMDELVVLVIEKGMITEVYNCNANQKIIVVDKDCEAVGETSVREFTWPETQYDDERVEKLLGIKPD